MKNQSIFKNLQLWIQAKLTLRRKANRWHFVPRDRISSLFPLNSYFSKILPAKSERDFWQLKQDTIRAPAGAWSLAVATIHRTVALHRSSFSSEKIAEYRKTADTMKYLLFLAPQVGLEPTTLRLTVFVVILLYKSVRVYIVSSSVI